MSKKILVTGGDGLIGNSFKSISNNYDNFEFIFTNRKEADLTKESDVNNLISKYKPEYVIHAAARVGGIGLNLNSPAEQFYNNIMMNTIMIEYCKKYNVKKLLAFSSACAFPGDLLIQKESELHSGEPFEAHRSYAYAKRMVDVQIEAYNKQYGLDYGTIIPGNIFGKFDNFNLQNGHVVPSLIHKCYNAKKTNTKFSVWGRGDASREFIYSDDVAKACVDLLEKKFPQRIIISGNVYKIKDIVSLICKYFNYYNIEWQTDKPEGQLYRSSDKTVFNSVLPDFSLSDIEESINKTCKWFEENFKEARK